MMTPSKKRNPFFSSLLSLLVPGLGQLYNGEPIKAVIFYLLQFALILVPFAIGLQYTPKGLFFIFIVIFVFYFFIMGEATLQSLLKKRIPLKSYHKWYVYILIIISANLFSASFNTLFKESLIGIRPFYLPSSSNEPTLLPGDHIIVDLHEKSPVKGTFIVFKFPKDPKKDFVKRVIAGSGDLLEIKNKQVVVNHQPVTEPYAVFKDPTIIAKSVSPRDNFGPTLIPDGRVFVMGDNRDQSFDSRFFGPVDESTIIGTALYIYWAGDKRRIGMTIQ